MKKKARGLCFRNIFLTVLLGFLLAAAGATAPRAALASDVADTPQQDIAVDGEVTVAVADTDETPSYKDVIDGVLSWAKSENGIDEDTPLLSGTFLDKAGTTAGDWYAIALGRLGLSDEGLENYRSALTIYVQNQYASAGMLEGEKATEWHRISIALLSLGGNPASIAGDAGTINLIADGTWNYETLTGKSVGTQGINAWIWALLSLDALDYEIPDGQTLTRAAILTQIASAANADGGYSLTGTDSDPDLTAMVLQALAPYYVDAETGSQETQVGDTTVTQLVDAALAFLSESQLADGDFASWGDGSCESVSQVIIALTSLGIDPLTDARFIKDGNTVYDGLLKYRQDDGGFAHSESTLTSGSNAMAGGQALCALAALVRRENGYSRLYDCTDPENADAVGGYVVNVFEGMSAQDAGGSFAEEDQAAYEALPQEITTEYAGEVSRLLNKLENADNQDDYSATLSGLQYFEAQIEEIQEQIDTINAWIEKNIYGTDNYDDLTEGDLLSTVDDADALSDYDKAQIDGYDDLVRVQKEISSTHRSKMLRGLIILVIVLVVASVLLDHRHKKKLQKAREEAEEDRSRGDR